MNKTFGRNGPDQTPRAPISSSSNGRTASSAEISRGEGDAKQITG
jgi:hypothetical protein